MLSHHVSQQSAMVISVMPGLREHLFGCTALSVVEHVLSRMQAPSPRAKADVSIAFQTPGLKLVHLPVPYLDWLETSSKRVNCLKLHHNEAK